MKLKYYGIPSIGFVAFLILIYLAGMEHGQRRSDHWWQKHARLLVTEVYVSPAGDDLNDCLTRKTACLTIYKALIKLDGPGTMYISDGFMEWDLYDPVCSNAEETDAGWKFCGVWLRRK